MLVAIHIGRQDDGSVRVEASGADPPWTHTVSMAEVKSAQGMVAALMDSFESGHRPLTDPVALAELGRNLHKTFLPELNTDQPAGRLLFRSSESDLLNLPWELLTGPDGRFLSVNPRSAIRRTAGESFCEDMPIAAR